MKLEITVPSVGESVTQGILSSWLKAEGDKVEEGSDLFELETDKATVTVPAPATGALSITVPAGTEVTIGQVVGMVDSEGGASASSAKTAATAAAAPAPARAAPSAPPAAAPAPAPRAAPSVPPAAAPAPQTAAPRAPRPAAPGIAREGERRVPMTTLRKRIAEKLVEAQHATASLTTFNEINMQKVSDLRSRYRDEFERVDGVWRFSRRHMYIDLVGDLSQHLLFEL